MPVEIRPFRSEDWNQLLELANLAVPFAPKENAEWLAYRKAFDESKRIRRHFMAIRNSRPLGYGCLEQQEETFGALRIYVVCSPDDLQAEVGAALFSQLFLDAKALKATSLWGREFLEDEPIRDFFITHGFIQTQQITIPGQRPMAIYRLGLS